VPQSTQTKRNKYHVILLCLELRLFLRPCIVVYVHSVSFYQIFFLLNTFVKYAHLSVSIQFFNAIFQNFHKKSWMQTASGSYHKKSK